MRAENCTMKCAMETLGITPSRIRENDSIYR
jgi:hypothetical protein